MPGIYKIGLTTRTPEERLANANASDTWKPPMPYQIVMTRRVNRVREIERTVHSLLEELGMRVHPRREFFRVSRSIVEKIFALVDPVTIIPSVDMTEVEAETASSTVVCICCHWSGPSHRLPKHALRCHKSAIYLSPHQLENCAVCYLVSGQQKQMFTTCLACEKGTVATPFSGNGARWVTRHATSTACHSVHATNLAEQGFPILEE